MDRTAQVESPWRMEHGDVTATMCTETSIMERQLFSVLLQIHFLMNDYGPANLWVDIMIKDELAAIFTLVTET